MTQAELKQQLNSMQDKERIEDVFFYTAPDGNTIVVVYTKKNPSDYEYNGYHTKSSSKIQDILNYFDTEDRITMGSNFQATDKQDSISL